MEGMDNEILTAANAALTEKLEQLTAELAAANAKRAELEGALRRMIAKAPGSGPLWYGSDEVQTARALLLATEEER